MAVHVVAFGGWVLVRAKMLVRVESHVYLVVAVELPRLEC